MDKIITVNDVPYQVVTLLGKGKGGYSYLVTKDNKEYVLKQIHHEPCSYYSFGNKIESELYDYNLLVLTRIKIPKMIDIDMKNERILKEFIKGDTIFDMVKDDIPVDKYIEQVKEMAILAKEHDLNIDYFPTNFIVQDDVLYYVDYECNKYDPKWNYDNWGCLYWRKSKEFLEYLGKNKG